MHRRDVLKGIGASSMAALGATGLATADDSVYAGEYIVTEIGGERQTLTLDEFEQHPDTGTLSDVETSCDAYTCCECCSFCCSDGCFCDYYCGNCPSC